MYEVIHVTTNVRIFCILYFAFTCFVVRDEITGIFTNQVSAFQRQLRKDASPFPLQYSDL